MYTVGIKKIIMHQGYLTTCPCDNCNQKEENEITVYCKAFVLGPFFWNWTWFAWDKQAYVECKSCKKHSNISELSSTLKNKAEESINEFPLWRKSMLGILVALIIGVNVLVLLYDSLKMAFTSDKSMISGHWIIQDEKTNYSNEDNIVKFINLYDDETYSIRADGDDYVSGKWDFNSDEKCIVLVDNQKNSSKLFIEELSDKKLEIKNIIDQKSIFKKHAYTKINLQKSDQDFNLINPYKPEYNKWRIKAERPETDAEIKKRVANLLYFYQVTFTEAVNKDVHTLVSEKSSPFIVASNGIAIFENQYWNDTFYSETDALKGYDLLKKIIPKEINDKEENHFIMLRDVFIAYNKNLD